MKEEKNKIYHDIDEKINAIRFVIVVMSNECTHKYNNVMAYVFDWSEITNEKVAKSS